MSGMNQGFTLDVCSFQKLLASAYVLQCQRDGKNVELDLSATTVREEAKPTPLKTPVVAKIPIALPVKTLPVKTKPVETLPVKTRAASEAAAEAAPVAEAAAGLHPAAKRESAVAAALALAEPSMAAIPASPVPLLAVLRLKLEGQLGVFARLRRTVRLRLNLRMAEVYGAPLAVLVIIAIFLLSQVAIRPSSAKNGVPPGSAMSENVNQKSNRVDGTAARAENLGAASATQDPPAVALLSSGTAVNTGHDLPTAANVKDPAISTSAKVSHNHETLKKAPMEPVEVETSHRRITDERVSSMVSSLSRYEMQSLRRQAQYGDAASALALGMIYEIGHPLRQSCTEASHWIAIAAAAGNAAAQYNLALRYFHGDGIIANRQEAKKWMREAARNGYEKAQLLSSSRELAMAKMH